MESKKHRLSLELSPKKLEQIDFARQHTGAVSQAEVVRQAIATYKFFVEQVQGGYTVFLRKEGEKDKDVAILSIEMPG